MGFFQKNPVVIQAVQLNWINWHDVCLLAEVGKLSEGKPEGCYLDEEGKVLPEGKSSKEMGLQIPTLEGLMLARQGDWIIKGLQGEIYPCKPGIFAATYTEVDPILGQAQIKVQEENSLKL